MRRILKAIIMIALVAIAFPAAAQSLPSSVEAAEILTKAQARMSLTPPGAPQFRLFAKLRFTLGKDTLEGTYEFLWAAADHYREEFRLGGMTAAYVVVQDKLCVSRNPSVLTYAQWRVRSLVGIAASGPAPTQIRVGKVYTSPNGPENVVCADLKGTGKKHTECFKSATGELVSIVQPATSGQLGLTEDSFLDLANTRYPGHIISTVGHETLEVNVEKLEVAPRFGDDVFAPPGRAIVRDWCAQPEVSDEKSGSPLMALISADSLHNLGGFHGFYAAVAPDGHPERVARINLDGSTQDLSGKDIPPGRFPIHRCGNRAIAYETIDFARPIN